MAGGFSVDLMTLQEAADGVNGTIDMVAQQPVDKIPFEQSAIGDDDNLASCCSGFFSGGQRGVSNLCQAGSQFVSRLIDAKNAYLKADKSVQTASGAIFHGTGTDPGLG